MTTVAFAALGFDPAPGDPGQVEALAQASSSAARAIGIAADRLTSARSTPSWDGEAAAAFAVDIGRLPADLGRAGAAYGRAGAALRSYGQELRAAQAEARSLEDRARRAADRARSTLLEDPAAQFRARAQATDEHHEVVRSAHRLHDRLDEAGDRAAALVQAATDTPPYQRPGLLARAAAAVDRWIDGNADTLRTASAGLKAVSAVAGLLAFVPVLTPICAPIAVATAVAALGVDAALAAGGHGNWRTVAVEALTTLLPGGRTLRAAGTVARRTDGIVDAANHGARGAARGDVLDEDFNAPARVVTAYRVEGRGNERILIDPRGNVSVRGTRRCLFLNFGSPERAKELLAQRRGQGLTSDVIKSFDVDAEFLNHLRRIAVAEEDTRRLGFRSFRCDVTKAPDQFGMRRPEIEELIRHIVPGSGRVR